MDLAWLEQDPSESPERVGGKPAPTRRETLEVRLEWLEEAPRQAAPARRRSSKSVPAVKAKRARQAWEPPTLPPPAPNATKSKRALPPPLPREEPEDALPRRPSKVPTKS